MFALTGPIHLMHAHDSTSRVLKQHANPDANAVFLTIHRYFDLVTVRMWGTHCRCTWGSSGRTEVDR